MKTVSLAAVLFLAVVFCFTSRALAAEPEVIRVQFSVMAPWKEGKAGNEHGIDIEFLRLLAQRMNLRIEFVHVPFARGLVCLEEGSIDLMPCVLHREDREMCMHFIQPPYHQFSPKAFYVLKDGGPAINSYTDLYGLRIGTVIGARYFSRFDEDIRLNKDAVRNSELNFKKLLDGRIDAMVLSETHGDRQLEHLDYAHRITKARYKYQRTNHVHMVLSRQSPLAERLDEFNMHMAALVREGAREKIKKKYTDTLSY
ncbi:substrate-binding periplasmic protein [Salidesulfovibrio onnuriiensis]|uniref:substrate-binding periplasmic protein n=1 Tax=Salidesulfovibrio onnuriiensis TaxID=2583823 RepID=UPI0011CB9D49|nr:transporter substrate-binding domain-containing protein [Salidesulfovibrio onnuriiensis]